MANRLPVIRLLHEFFGDWQLLLFTYDRAWYEIAKQQLDGWKLYELFTVQVGDHERPLVKEDTDHLSRALDFLLAGEVKAAAVHVRTKFEKVLKAGCVRLGVKVPYATNPRTVTANDLWSCLQAHPVAKLPPHVFWDGVTP